MKRRTVRAYMRNIEKHLRDSSAASAALLFNTLPIVMELPDREKHARLEHHVRASILAFLKFAPKPSSN